MLDRPSPSSTPPGPSVALSSPLSSLTPPDPSDSLTSALTDAFNAVPGQLQPGKTERDNDNPQVDENLAKQAVIEKIRQDKARSRFEKTSESEDRACAGCDTPKSRDSRSEERSSEGASNGENEEGTTTPPPSPTNKVAPTKTSLFSLSQVSSKLGELWSSARESLFGEDYWIPSDPNEIVYFPNELLRAHKTIFPVGGEVSVLRVVQGSLKNRPAEPLHHVVFSYNPCSSSSPSYSLFRSHELEEAIDLCRRCLECKILFTVMDPSKENKKHISEMIVRLKQHPLYRMIHIAIICNREDTFTEANVEFVNKNYMPFTQLMKMVVQPEGKYPLHLAIEVNRPRIVRRMLELGADATVRDVAGNNCLHYASLVSVQMLETLWEFETCHQLLNQINNEGMAPVVVAIRNANPRCLATLLGFGAEMSVRVQGRNPLFEAMQSKGKNTDIIKAIIEASPDLVNERDASGNTALHVAMYKTPVMGLLLLKRNEIDVDAVNNAGQTPLHIYTHKSEIGLMITLLSYCCDINKKDLDGNTALHIAVSKKNLEASRLLLCLGANPNLTNAHGDSPRHLAARLKESALIKSLILCGARRCETNKQGCVSACVNESMIGLLKGQSLVSNDCCESPRSSAVFSAEHYPDSVEVDHPIRDFTQKIFYDQLISHLESLAERGEQPVNIVNLLSLDGGGIRGLVILQTLLAIEDAMGEPIYKYFDWVAGTSTGALVAVSLAQGKTIREIQHIYLRFKDLVFDGWTRPYNSLVLESFMKEQVGEGSLADITYPRLLISTVKADYFPVKLELMRNYRLPLSEKDNEELGFTNPNEIPIWKALRRTSAAPMFFSPVDNKYIDGGIIANNPCLDLLSEVQLYNGTNSYMKKESDKVSIGCVLSLGTGQIPLSPLDPLHVEYTNPISSAVAFKNLSLILVDQVTATEGAPVDRSRMWCNALGVPFFRLSAPLHKDVSLGAKDDHIIAAMMWDCIEYTHQHRPYINKLCALLRKIGKIPDRPPAFYDGKTREMQTQTSYPGTPT